MLYVRCPTCHELLGHLQIPLEEGMQKIDSNLKLSDDERNNKKRELINSFNLKDYCCKMRLLTYVDTIHILESRRE
jgi:DNA-directed RNA polymerase subunit N (RpoN/RPB10)